MDCALSRSVPRRDGSLDQSDWRWPARHARPASVEEYVIVPDRGPPILEVEDLSTHFFNRDGVVHAIDGVSYSVSAGEVLGVVGESGCGKSMTALSIMGLVPKPAGRIVSGSIRLMGRELVSLPDSEMRRVRGSAMGMIFQEPMTSLNPVLTIGYQVAE